MWFGPDMFFGMGAGSVALTALFGLLLALYVLYDIIVQRDEMLLLERVIWVLLIFTANLLGVVLYIFIVMIQGTTLNEMLGLEAVQQSLTARRVSELERLHRLHEEGALTDEEFEREKERLLE